MKDSLFERVLDEEVDDTEVMIGDVRKNSSDEVYVVTAVNESISNENSVFFHTIKNTGETSNNKSEDYLANCSLLGRYEDWEDAVLSAEFNF